MDSEGGWRLRPQTGQPCRPRNPQEERLGVRTVQRDSLEKGAGCGEQLRAGRGRGLEPAGGARAVAGDRERDQGLGPGAGSAGAIALRARGQGRGRGELAAGAHWAVCPGRLGTVATPGSRGLARAANHRQVCAGDSSTLRWPPAPQPPALTTQRSDASSRGSERRREEGGPAGGRGPEPRTAGGGGAARLPGVAGAPVL